MKLITVKEAAKILGISPSSIYSNSAGTDKLTKVRQGRAVRLIESEVLGYRDRKIAEARKQKGTPDG